jgi:hypothetical protein
MEIFNTYNINPILVRNTQNGVFNNTYFSITEVNSTLNFGEYITVSGTQLIAQNPISVKSTLLLEGSSTITGDVYLNASGTYNITDFTWQTRTTNSNSWRDVVWAKELNLFACVSASGNTSGVMTSPDGITWTTRTTIANNWVGLTWSSELLLFVAVGITGTGNRVMTSPDGITWTTRTSAADNNWSNVVWSKELNLFVAVAYSGTNDRVMTSPDGITWTTRFTPTNNQFYSVAWSPQLGLFAVVSIN